jgi:hypothetical protein
VLVVAYNSLGVSRQEVVRVPVSQPAALATYNVQGGRADCRHMPCMCVLCLLCSFAVGCCTAKEDNCVAAVLVVGMSQQDEHVYGADQADKPVYGAPKDSTAQHSCRHVH